VRYCRTKARVPLLATPFADNLNHSVDGEMETMLQEIYREHGWPNLENYKKEECIQAVKQALAKQYPDFELYW
jgi:hypothetical protein